MEDDNKPPGDFYLELKLHLKRRKMLVPMVVVGLALINSPKFWDVLERLLAGVH